MGNARFNSIYLDFDGTVTKYDTVNAFFKTFADTKWEDIEKEWVEGKINSKTCMQKQLDLISGLTEQKLNDFIDGIEIQDGFREFYSLMKKDGKKITILSDGFDFFISKILQREHFSDITFYSNKLNIYKEKDKLRFYLEFPNEDKNCPLSLGTCKCAKVKNDIGKDENFIYAGDGLSDRCIASKSILLFAKGSLKKHCIKNGINFVGFNNFFDIINYLAREGDLQYAGFKAKDADRRAD